MLPQSHDAAIVHGLFHQNQYTLDIECCSDVYDEAGRLIKLSLTGNRHLSDEPDFLAFPENFHELTSLSEIYIYAPLVSFPAQLCQMTSLQAFVLSDFCPADVFPIEFAQLVNLRYLGLGGLRWAQVPPAIWRLPNLRVLDLSENALTSLPPEIGQLPQLRSLYLLDNRLLHLPPEIGQLTELVELEIWPHKLQTLPKEIARLRNLHSLNLSQKLLETTEIIHIAREMGMYLLLQLELRANMEREAPNSERKKQNHEPAGNPSRGRGRSAVGRMPG